jgi:hypothetical protein
MISPITLDQTKMVLPKAGARTRLATISITIRQPPLRKAAPLA